MSLHFFPPNRMNPYTGYGRNEYGLMRGLAQIGINLSPLADVALTMGNPKNVEHPALRGKKRVLYTMSESTKVSGLWVDQINRKVDLVLVPCPMLVGIYQSSGIEVPVVDVGHGVDLSVPELPEHACERSNGDFWFLTYSLGDLRKGAEKAVIALLSEFADEPHVKIAVKTPPKNTWLAGAEGDRVKVFAEEMDERRWFDVLQQHHCFVFPSRGEGWGMPPREATLAGLPTIATEWLGMWDVSEWGVPLRIQGLSPSNYADWQANAHDSYWADPDMNHLRQQMREVYTHYLRYRSKAIAGREYLLNTYSYKRVAIRIAGAIHRAGFQL